MTRIVYDTKHFKKTMNNVLQYSFGFLDGVKINQVVFNAKLAELTEEALKKFIDTKARMYPESLHHVYEWNSVGNASSRLFEINSTVTKNNISFTGQFLQSESISDTSDEPFYDKARIMENQIAIEVEPRSANVLAFEDGSQTVFTVNSVFIENPGGDEVAGAFGRVVDDFFDYHFTSTFLRQSGIFDQLSFPVEYTQYFNQGAKMGRSAGRRAGQKYMDIQAGIG